MAPARGLRPLAGAAGMCEKSAVFSRVGVAALLVVALVAGLACVAGLGGCGTRTGLLLDTDPNAKNGEGDGVQGGADAALDDAGDPDVDAGVHCALNVGPVSSCDAGASAGPVQLCSGKYAACVRVFEPDSGVPWGDWGCCMANPPENVPQCQERQFFDAGCF